jgi:hypothetical protein
MRDHVVRLRAPDVSLAAAMQATVALKLEASAPRGRWRLRLWDANGRNPVRVQAPKGDDFGNAYGPSTVTLPGDNLDGKTLTWVVRLQGTGSYKVQMTILQDGEPASGGEFIYTGPLAGVEEITGRFHFNLVNQGETSR